MAECEWGLVQGASVQTIPVVRQPVNTARPPVNASIRCLDQSETDGRNLRAGKPRPDHGVSDSVPWGGGFG